jgi:hypothetical protein
VETMRSVVYGLLVLTTRVCRQSGHGKEALRLNAHLQEQNVGVTSQIAESTRRLIMMILNKTPVDNPKVLMDLCFCFKFTSTRASGSRRRGGRNCATLVITRTFSDWISFRVRRQPLARRPLQVRHWYPAPVCNVPVRLNYVEFAGQPGRPAGRRDPNPLA